MARTTTSSSALSQRAGRVGHGGRGRGRDRRRLRRDPHAREVVRVGGNARVAAPLRRQLGGGSPVRPRPGRRRPAGAAAPRRGAPARTHSADRTRVLGREPVEQHAVGHLAGEPAHPGPEGGDVEARPEDGVGARRRRPARARAPRVRAPHPQQKAISGQRVRADGRDDGVRAAGVERHHADTERDAGGLVGRQGERGQAIDRAGIVHPEGPVAECLRAPCRRADHLRRHAGLERESPRHQTPLVRLGRLMPAIIERSGDAARPFARRERLRSRRAPAGRVVQSLSAACTGDGPRSSSARVRVSSAPRVSRRPP